MAHLLVCLRARKGGRRGLVGVEQGAAAEVNDGEGVSADDGGDERLVSFTGSRRS